MSYHEDRYIEYLGERDGRFGSDAWLEQRGDMAVVKKLRGDSQPKKVRAKTVTDEAAEAYRLPTEVSEPVDDLGGALILIHGERKIGKTSMSMRAPKNILLAAEIGYKGLRGIHEDIEDWRKAEVVRRALKKDKTFKTVTVDTVDILYKLCEAQTCRDLGIKDLGDEDYGKGWRENRKRFEAYINSLAATGKGIILLSHSTEQEITKRGGDTYTRITSSMAKQAREIVDGLVDIWGYFTYDGTRRVLVIQGDDHIAAGHRFEERFRTPGGLPLRQIDMGRNPTEAWKNFTDAFANKYEPVDENDIVNDEEDDEDEDRPRKKKSKTVKVKLKKK